VPQSLVQTPRDAGQPLDVNGRALTASHEQIVSILRSRLGQNHGDLLAVPKPQADGSIAWTTALPGAVVPVDELGDEDRAKIQRRFEQLTSDIRGLAQQLRGEGPASQIVAHMLERAVQTPPGRWLYSVGGKPVLALWGHAAPGTPPAPAVTVAAPAAPAVAGVTPSRAAPVAAPAPPAADVPSSPAATATEPGGAAPAAVEAPAASVAPGPGGAAWKRWLAWVIAALALLALLFLGWRCSTSQQTADADLADSIAKAESHNRELEEELARKRAQPVMQCVPEPAPPAASAPPPPPPPEPQPASAPEPQPASAPEPAKPPPVKPLDALKKRIADAGTNCDALGKLLDGEPMLKGNDAQAAALKQQIVRTMGSKCRDRAIREAKNLCPGQRPPELAPEMALVFDASGSMNYSLDASEREIAQFEQQHQIEQMMRQFGLGRMPGGIGLERITREPRRISVARRATHSVVQRLPSDMSVGLVMVDECPAARPVGRFAPAQRGALLGQIEGIQPRAGTPLADGIAKAGQMVDGVGRDALMVVVSDGVESCGQDPCAVAAALHRAKPRLKINVVDITGTGAGNCVASATGGKVFTANNANELVAMTERATSEAMGPDKCK
jgi:hypothetical protein